MSRYTTSKHGVIIGWDDTFSFTDKAGVRRYFNAILWTDDYRTKEINSVNVWLRTPAQQILYTDTGQRDVLRVSSYIRWRCVQEDARFVLAPYSEQGAAKEKTCPTLFFEKVSQARFVRNEIERMLVGLRGQGKRKK